MKWAGHIVRIEDRRGAYRGLVGRPEGKRPIGRHRGRVEDNIKMYVVNAVMSLRVPRNAGNFLTSCETVSFSRRNLLHGVSRLLGLLIC